MREVIRAQLHDRVARWRHAVGGEEAVRRLLAYEQPEAAGREEVHGRAELALIEDELAALGEEGLHRGRAERAAAKQLAHVRCGRQLRRKKAELARLERVLVAEDTPALEGVLNACPDTGKLFGALVRPAG